jgi:AcrR family transcriptional regulator
MAARVATARTDEPQGRERQRLETRRRIYEAAIAEFRQEGFAAAQVDRIVEVAGVARGTFYFHFPTKEHVLLELQREMERGAVERLGDFLRRPASMRTRLERVVDALLTHQEEVGDAALTRELLAMYVRQRVEYDPADQPFLRLLMQLFASAIERGEVRADLTPQELMTIFGGLLFMLFAGEWPSEAERRAALRSPLNVFIRGISP